MIILIVGGTSSVQLEKEEEAQQQQLLPKGRIMIETWGDAKPLLDLLSQPPGDARSRTEPLENAVQQTSTLKSSNLNNY